MRFPFQSWRRWPMLWAIVALLLALFLSTGCGQRVRAQAAANLDAGIEAAAIALANHATEDAVAILTGARKYVAPTAGVPHADWPAARLSPQAIVADPKAYSDAAPPEPSGWGWGMIGGAGLVGLATLRVMAPLIPGAGPLVKIGADLAWTVLANREQKKADAAKEAVVAAAQTAIPLLEVLRGLDPETVPPYLVSLIRDKDISRAIEALAAGGKS